MYPTLVVVLVASRRSVLERSITIPMHVDGIRRAITRAERREHAGCARCDTCPTCSSLDNVPNVGDTPWLGVSFDRNLGLTSMVSTLKDEDELQAYDGEDEDASDASRTS